MTHGDRFTTTAALMASPHVRLSLLLLLLLTVAGSCGRVAAADHCATHHFAGAGATAGMQFTKEVASKEYAQSQEYKSLHCCARGYQSIEW